MADVVQTYVFALASRNNRPVEHNTDKMTISYKLTYLKYQVLIHSLCQVKPLLTWFLLKSPSPSFCLSNINRKEHESLLLALKIDHKGYYKHSERNIEAKSHFYSKYLDILLRFLWLFCWNILVSFGMLCRSLSVLWKVNTLRRWRETV